MTVPLHAPGIIVQLNDVEWTTNETVDPPMWPIDKIRWKTLVSEERSGSRDLLLGIAELDAGEVHVLHDHPDSSEVYYILQGTARAVMNGRQIEVGPGTALFFPPQTKHEIANIGDQTLTFLWAFNKGTAELERWDERYTKAEESSLEDRAVSCGEHTREPGAPE